METTVEARKKRSATRRYHVVRVLLFATACICAVVGMLMLTMASDKQARSETVMSEVARSESQANVLLIMSYNDADVLTPLARKGVIDIMNASAVAVDVEYMDAINCPKGSAAYKTWEKTIEEKLSGENPYHSIICCDDEALTFVEDHYGDIFNGLPVVFFNVNDFDHARAAANSGYATGYVEQGNVSQIVALSKELRPNATKFMAITDDTPAGVGDRAQFKEAVADTGMTAEYVNASTLTRDALAQRIGSAGDDTIVFLLDAYNDVSGKAYTRDETARFVSEASNQPVFGIATGGVGEGLVGSSFTDSESDGQRAANTCIEILNGTSPGTIPLDTDGVEGFAFDAAVLAKYGIPLESLPANAVAINRSAFTLDSVKGMLPAIGLLILAIACVLAFALMGYRHSIQNTQEIIAQANDLRHRYYHDPLTDKLNVQWFREFAANTANIENVKALVQIDFMDFGDVNDSYGQATGDAVLKEYSDRLEAIEEKAFLVRSTGSEFIMAFTNEITADGPELKNIWDLLKEPVVLDDAEIEVNPRIGFANLSDALSLDDMVVGVDLAVREAKQERIANMAVRYEERMKHEMEEKIGVTALLKQSIKEESFVVLYQPQISLHENDVYGYEALVRMKGDAYYPGQFIPVAELSGLVIDVDRIVTKKVVQQLAEWKRRGQRIVPVAINYSAVQLKDVGYVDFLVDLLKENDVEPAYVKIEITESLLLGDEGGADRLFERLGAEGIPVALDDFGTGYTSLSSVATMPANIVKIDKSLVDEYALPGKERFLDNLVRLVHDLDKSVIVEGVETADQLQICRDLGCDIVQGYFFSKPLPPEDAAQYEPFPKKVEEPPAVATPAEPVQPIEAVMPAEPVKPAEIEQPARIEELAQAFEPASAFEPIPPEEPVWVEEPAAVEGLTTAEESAMVEELIRSLQVEPYEAPAAPMPELPVKLEEAAQPEGSKEPDNAKGHDEPPSFVAFAGVG